MSIESDHNNKNFELSKEMGIPLEAYLEIIKVFFQSTDELIEKLHSAIQLEKMDNIAFLAHSIKGSALNFRYTEIAKIAATIEEKAGNNEFKELDKDFYILKLAFENALNSSRPPNKSKIESNNFKENNKYYKDGNLILVVDDNPANVEFLESILTNNGYKVATCNNGKQALTFLKNTFPDLILLDVMMPEIDGFQICGKLKEHPDTNSIPVIFLTARADTDSIVKGFNVGGKDYLTKPFNSSELLVRVKTQITLQKQLHEIQHGKAQIEKERQISETKNDLFSNFLRLSGKLETHDFTQEIGLLLQGCPEFKFAEYFHLEIDMVNEDLLDHINKFFLKNDLTLTPDDKNALLKSIKQSTNEKELYIKRNLKNNTIHIASVNSNVFTKKNQSSIKGILVAISSSENIHLQNKLFRIVVKFTSVVEELFISNQRLKQLHQVEYELKAAEKIQRSLLPKSFPDSNVFDIYGINKSHGSVGGDFFNVFNINYGKIGCCIADVSGKGLPAALMATSIWTKFRDVVNDKIYDTKALEKLFKTIKNNSETIKDISFFQRKILSAVRSLNLDEMFVKLNNSALEILDDYSFVTMMYVLLDEQNQSMNYVNAGHVPLLTFIKKAGKAEFIELPSTPIGILPDVNFPARSISLASGDILLLYTDGIIEAKKTTENGYTLFGEKRLEQLFASLSSLSAKEITEEIQKSVTDYAQGNLSDDLTIITIKVK